MTANELPFIVFDGERARPVRLYDWEAFLAKRVDLPGDVTLHIAREGHNGAGVDEQTGPFYCLFVNDNASPLVTKSTVSDATFQIMYAPAGERNMYVHRPWQAYQLRAEDLLGTNQQVLTDPNNSASKERAYVGDWLIRQPDGLIHIFGEVAFRQLVNVT
ncbi:MAG TPA: hypothetical protein VLA88_06065 [Candidatus Saccharimonadales bacterium]|nr:hypothetical protein [Candidatus Saccharimonadales bacterium]